MSGVGVTNNSYTLDLHNVRDGVSLARSGPDLRDGVAVKHLSGDVGQPLGDTQKRDVDQKTLGIHYLADH